MDYEYFLYAYTKYIYPNIGTGFLIVLIMFFIVLLLYMMKGLGLWRIAKAQEVKNFAMSFVPIGSSWLTGIIADKYEALVKKRTTNMRKYVLLSGVLAFGMMLIFTVVFICVFYYRCMTLQISGLQMSDILPRLTGLLVSYYIAMMCAEIIQIGHLILYYMALYNVYRFETEKRAVLYLVLSILLFFAAPVILYILGKRDQHRMREERRTKRISERAVRTRTRTTAEVRNAPKHSCSTVQTADDA